jgi:isoleucyl-tRNA synthetase
LVNKREKLDTVQIFHKFGFKLDARQLAMIDEDGSKAVALFAERGRLSDSELLRLYRWTQTPAIQKRLVPLETPRSDLTISRQRCVMLLNPQVQGELSVRREKLIKEAKERAKANRQRALHRLQTGKKKAGNKRAAPRNGTGSNKKAKKGQPAAPGYGSDDFEAGSEYDEGDD